MLTELDPLVLSLAGAALLAGVLDAIAGGGGLILVPALFSALPTALPSTLFATNKLSGVFGTALAARTYAKTYPVDWSLVLPASCAALVFGALGARAMTMFPPEIFRKLLPFVLTAVALYVFRRKDFGGQFAPTCTGTRKTMLALGIGGTIGVYDGFFGPGTGSFLIFLFIRTFGLDFLRASAAAKIVNVACNLAALAWFIPTTEPLWLLAGVMAVCNMAGALLGARLALREGAGFVRQIFLLLVVALIAKTGWDAFGPGL